MHHRLTTELPRLFVSRKPVFEVQSLPLCAVSSGHYAAKHGLKPIARILGQTTAFTLELSLICCLSFAIACPGFADAERAPVEFPIAPSDAIPKALKNAGVR